MAGLSPMWRHLNCKEAPEKLAKTARTETPSGLGKCPEGGFHLCAKAMSIDILRFSRRSNQQLCGGRCIATDDHSDNLFLDSQFERYFTHAPSAHLERPVIIGIDVH
eukprot:s549_g9.t1